MKAQYTCAAALAAAILLFSSTSVAQDPIALPAGPLAADEGYLLFITKSNISIKAVEVDRKGGLLGDFDLEDIPSGRNVRIEKLKAGEYQFERISRAASHYRLGEGYDFRIEAGKLNYPGDLVFESIGFFGSRAKIRLMNKLTQAIVDLEDDGPAILGDLDLVYQGPFDDSFPAYVRSLEGEPTGHGDVLEPGYSDWLDEWFRIWKNREFRLQPEGQFVAWAELIDGNDQIVLRNNTTGEKFQITTKLAHRNSPVLDIQWIDDDSLMYSQYVDGNRGPSWSVLHMTIDGEQASLRHHFRLRHYGRIVDPQLNREDRFLFAYAGDSEGRKIGLYGVDVSTSKNLPSQFVVKKQLTRSIKGAYHWVVDQQGITRMVLSSREEGKVTYYYLDPRGKRWRKHLVLDSDDAFSPVAFEGDGKTLLVISNKGGDRAGLYRMDLETNTIGDAVYLHPSVDVKGTIVRASDRKVIGVRYFSAGKLVSSYFPEVSGSESELGEHFQDLGTPHVIERSHDGNRLLVFVTRFSDPGAFYLFESHSNEVTHLADVDPRFAEMPKARQRLVKVVTDDGFEIEGYLTLPEEESQQLPVLVVPHGGPIGAQDVDHFDSATHFLASIGVAVLRVNYRGSSGYGRSFEDAGKQQWGRRIESDVEAVLAKAVQDYDLDADRICIGGISYGGYSALISIVRSPHLYKCAASYAGVTDLPLIFNNARISRREYVIEELSEIVGNPDEQQETLIELSPVYRAAEFDRPVFLAHGLKDAQVEAEHTLRLNYALRRHGKPPRLLLFSDEAHGFDSLWGVTVYYNELAHFLAENLDFELPESSIAPPEEEDEGVDSETMDEEKPAKKEGTGNDETLAEDPDRCEEVIEMGNVTVEVNCKK